MANRGIMEAAEDHEVPVMKTRPLPADLPTSLDDRRSVPRFGDETEIYDAWQGQSQFLTSPIPAQALTFNNLSLDQTEFDSQTQDLGADDERYMQMLAAQAKLRTDSSYNEETVVADEKLSEEEKKETLQGMLATAASNGEVDRVRGLLSNLAKKYVDVNIPDAGGTTPLIYASCFGHEEVVTILLDAGADVNKQDSKQWTPLMWAMTNKHKSIAKILLDHGASPDAKSSSGRTVFDFAAPDSELSGYLQESGYNIGNAGVTDDWYNAGFSQDRFEEEMAENELKRRMMMESAINLEVDLGNLGLDEQPESPEEFEEEENQEFVWDRCLNDQMFVFQETELDRILDVIITHMTPQRTHSQKPVPANILFLGARYAHYHSSVELLEKLLMTAMDKINDVIESHQWDMTILAFWMSNATLLLHYLKKDPGLLEATIEFQQRMAELINEIFILITRDAERRMDKVLDAAMLDHETIPGFEDVHFQNEWKIFRSKPKFKAPEPLEKMFRPPSPKRRAQISPRNISSLLSSTLFVLDLYDIHSVITAQILSQLFYWLSAELFNRVMSNRKYLARTKAMQIRMNISTLEDWARTNNRQPEHYENGSMTSTSETTGDAARRHLAPVVQLLQWLQCFSSLGDDLEPLIVTLQQLPRLTPMQLVHAAKYYRAEVGEKALPKTGMRYLLDLQREVAERKAQAKQQRQRDSRQLQSPPSTPVHPGGPSPGFESPSFARQPGQHDPDDAPDDLLLDPTLMLPFSLPTSTDMLVSYGAGFGGLNRERARKYIPTVPSEFLTKLDINGGQRSGGGTTVYGNKRWDEDG